MHKSYRVYILLLNMLCMIFISSSIWAYGTMSPIYFPSTISTDDPYILDKLILSVFRTESPSTNNGDTWTTNPKLLYGKTITKDLIVSLNASYLHIKNPGQKPQNGFDNWTVGLRYNVFSLAKTGSIFSIQFDVTPGGTGSHIVNAASTTTLAPELIFGQYLGIVPDSIKYLRPFGFFVTLAPNIVTSNFGVTSVNFSATIEYSLPYFNKFVAHLHSPLMEHLVPIVEFPYSICTQGSCQSRLTGTINPGFISYNKYCQFGVEAIIPGNGNTGSRIGGVLQLHFYLDNIFPNSIIGKPIL